MRCNQKIREQIIKPCLVPDVKGKRTEPSKRVDDPSRDVTGYVKTDLAATFRKAREAMGIKERVRG